MAITREKKEQFVVEYRDTLSRSKAVFLTDYRGLSVPSLQMLRGKIREVNGGHLVVKNNLVRIALREAEMPIPEEMLTGPVAISFAFGDVPALAKVLIEYAKSSKVLQIKGGIVEGKILSPAQVESISVLPPREVVLSQLLGVIQQPGNRVAGALSAAGAKLAATIKAYAEKLEGSPVVA